MATSLFRMLAASLDPKREKMSFDALPNDIHYLIASELMKLSESTVRALGQTSRGLRQAVLPYIYRSIVLKGSPSDGGTHDSYQSLVETFRKDSDDGIAKHVRSIVVKNEIPEEDLMAILAKISEFGILRELR